MNQSWITDKYDLSWKHVLGVAILLVFVGLLISATQTKSSLSAQTSQPQNQTATQDGPASTTQAAAVTQATQSNTNNQRGEVAQASGTPRSTSAEPNDDTDQPSPNITNPDELFASLNLSAESVVVWNQDENSMIYEKQSRKEQPLASLTKLMTALVARENTSGSTTAVVTDQHLQAVGEYGLQAGEQWPLDQLIRFMLVQSSNDAARAVASAVTDNPNDGYASKFVDMMNETANNLGLQDTYFFNPSGLDINEELISGGYGTAYDTVRLFDYIASNYPELLLPTTRQVVQTQASSGQQYTAQNTNEDIDQYAAVFGSKTGYTVLAGGNLVMGFDLQKPVIIALFGSSKQGRFADMQQLHQASKRYFELTN
jgi:D-alanyl-D-alanine carboxypeptidase